MRRREADNEFRVFYMPLQSWTPSYFLLILHLNFAISFIFVILLLIYICVPCNRVKTTYEDELNALRIEKDSLQATLENVMVRCCMILLYDGIWSYMMVW